MGGGDPTIGEKCRGRPVGAREKKGLVTCLGVGSQEGWHLSTLYPSTAEFLSVLDLRLGAPPQFKAVTLLSKAGRDRPYSFESCPPGGVRGGCGASVGLRGAGKKQSFGRSPQKDHTPALPCCYPPLVRAEEGPQIFWGFMMSAYHPTILVLSGSLKASPANSSSSGGAV